MLTLAATRFAQTVQDAQPLTDDATTPMGTDSDLNVPTESLPTAEQVEQGAGILAGIGAVLFILSVLSFVSFIFLVLALIHLIKNNDVPNRVLWIVLSIFIPFAGLVYVVGPRRSYNKNKGSAGSEHPLANNSPQSQPAAPFATAAPQSPNPTPVVPTNQPEPVQPQQPVSPVQPAQPVQPQQFQQPVQPTAAPQTFAPQQPVTQQPAQVQPQAPVQPQQQFQQPQPQVFSPDVTPPPQQNSNPDNRIQ